MCVCSQQNSPRCAWPSSICKYSQWVKILGDFCLQNLPRATTFASQYSLLMRCKYVKICKSDFPALVHFRFFFRWEKHGIPDMKAREYHTAGTTLIHAMIHCRPLMNPMFSPFKSTLGQSGQTINAHERSPGERQKVPLSSQCQGNQGNDLLLPKSNDDFFNLHSPWHFLAHQTLHHSLLAERLPVGFMGITWTLPASTVPAASSLTGAKWPLVPSRSLPVPFPQSNHWSTTLCPASKTTHPWVSLHYHLCVFENQIFLDNSFFIQL